MGAKKFSYIPGTVNWKMSGRLVILRHKSWNVWNADNKEKVLRDERLHKEQLDEKNKQERELISEKQREALSNDDKSPKLEHVNLFDDLSKIDKKRENEDYVKERNDKETKRLKQEGVAPWALSEGTNTVPWYAKSSSSRGASASKDESWKSKLDPANKFVEKKSALIKAKSITQQPSSSSAQQAVAKPQVISSSSATQVDLINELRKKRLDREKAERHRASVLLAEYDIYGSNKRKNLAGSDSSYSYMDQSSKSKKQR